MVVNEDVDPEESGDPSVPTELLELHLELEEAGITPEQFKDAFDETDNTT